MTTQKRHVAEQIWLDYFNKTLFNRGIINEATRNKLSLKIDARKPSGTMRSHVPSDYVN